MFSSALGTQAQAFLFFSLWTLLFVIAWDETAVVDLVGVIVFCDRLVLFDMTVEDRPVVGIGKLNKNYVPVKEVCFVFS